MKSTAKKTKIQYVCQNCGYVSLRWLGRCSECGAWNSMVEEKISPIKKTSSFHTTEGSLPIPLSEINWEDQPRISVNSEELNRILGGGIVRGSLILIGGDPGIGKSTLMLQEGAALAKQDFPVLYVTGEESIQQTKLRAQRLGVDSKYLFILSETNLDDILAHVDKFHPQLIIVDSIQTIYNPAFESSPGSVTQVRESALSFLKIAKTQHIPVFLIGHITKEGYIAGPKLLEHMVDVLLQFEGDRDYLYRILRSVKNRFGSTREIGIFEMTGQGLREVKNPSEIFLSQRNQDISGSSVVCILEGSRPFLVEIQALVSPTSYGMPQRTATGIDHKRMALLLAVIEKRLGLKIGAYDVFFNVAGGVRIDEPSADLGIITSIVSSFKNQIIDSNVVIIGEVGLGGEIRPVAQIEKRIEEAAKLGFTKAIIPQLNLKNLVTGKDKLQIIPVKKVEEALEEVLN